ncbi:hypothetical protein ACQ4PT_019043 [Festuca glaucescens]
MPARGGAKAPGLSFPGARRGAGGARGGRRRVLPALALFLDDVLRETHGRSLGGPGPEVDDKQDGPTDYKIPLDGVDLRNHDACHAAVLKLLSAMPGSTAMVDHGAGKWYEPMVRAAADDIVSQLQPVTRGEETRGYAVDVSLSIQESFRYVEPEALLLACEQAAIHSCRTPDEHCAVCMEPLPDPTDDRLAVRVDDKAFTLPSCRHTFHRRCIATWFEKGSTCPLCRCDMMYCLVDVEKQFENIARNIC